MATPNLLIYRLKSMKPQSPSLTLNPIGILHSCYPDKFGTPRQSGLVPQADGFLEIFPEYQPEEALQGIEGFSHLWVLFWFHKLESQRFHSKVHPPRLGGESMGLFATRTPHRPNPIGLSLLRVGRVQKNGLEVFGHDFIDQTPILDIKPYLPQVESIPEARGGWTTSLEQKQEAISVVWNQEQVAQLREMKDSRDEHELKSLIDQTLRLDPRPIVYRGYEGAPHPTYRSKHAVRIHHLDIHFEFVTPKEIQIIEVKRDLKRP